MITPKARESLFDVLMKMGSQSITLHLEAAFSVGGKEAASDLGEANITINFGKGLDTRIAAIRDAEEQFGLDFSRVYITQWAMSVVDNPQIPKSHCRLSLTVADIPESQISKNGWRVDLTPQEAVESVKRAFEKTFGGK